MREYSKQKILVLRELKLRQREFLESKLAHWILNSKLYLSSVEKITLKIVVLIKQNIALVTELINKNEQIKKEMFSPNYFGHFHESLKQVPTQHLVQEIINQLIQNKFSIAQIMQFHGIFIHYLFDALLKNNPENKEQLEAKRQLVEILFPNKFFSKENRGRIEKSASTTLSHRIGICNNSVFARSLPSCESHTKALFRFDPDQSSTTYQTMQTELIPFVSGPSGHTGSLLLGALLYGNLNPQELSEYTLMIFAFLTAGGNHSGHEVMLIARQVGINARNLFSQIHLQSQEDLCDLLPYLTI